MLIQFVGTGDGFEFRFKVKWVVLVAFAKALVTTILAMLVLWLALLSRINGLI